MKKRVLLSWSSGKDSAWALHVLRQQSEFDVVGLFTTVNQVHDRVAMHAVRRELLMIQAQHVGLPFEVDVSLGEVVERGGFVFADLLPAIVDGEENGA